MRQAGFEHKENRRLDHTLNLAAVFRQDAGTLCSAREKALQVHRTDIRAAGNEVEVAVRQYLRRMLQPRYHVTSGHLVDSSSRVSPQIDIVISDNLSLPSLLTTQDGTEYIPIDSVLAIGEVKSTYYKSQGYYRKLESTLQSIDAMDRPLLENTAYDGIQDHTLLQHMAIPSKNRHLNSLYTFLICVDGGDFDFLDVKSFLNSADAKNIPATSILLNKGIVAHAKPNQQGGLTFTKYPGEISSDSYRWCYFEGKVPEGGSLSGTHLAFLYGSLVEHLANSYLDPPSAYQYMANVGGGLKASLVWA